MKTYILPAILVFAVGCSSSKSTKYDFSNVQTTSLGAMHPSPSVYPIDTTLVIIQSHQSTGVSGIAIDTTGRYAPVPNYDFNNVKSISTDGMQPASGGSPKQFRPEPTVPKHDPLQN